MVVVTHFFSPWELNRAFSAQISTGLPPIVENKQVNREVSRDKINKKQTFMFRDALPLNCRGTEGEKLQVRVPARRGKLHCIPRSSALQAVQVQRRKVEGRPVGGAAVHLGARGWGLTGEGVGGGDRHGLELLMFLMWTVTTQSPPSHHRNQRSRRGAK